MLRKIYNSLTIALKDSILVITILKSSVFISKCQYQAVSIFESSKMSFNIFGFRLKIGKSNPDDYCILGKPNILHWFSFININHIQNSGRVEVEEGVVFTHFTSNSKVKILIKRIECAFWKFIMWSKYCLKMHHLMA